MRVDSRWSAARTRAALTSLRSLSLARTSSATAIPGCQITQLTSIGCEHSIALVTRRIPTPRVQGQRLFLRLQAVLQQQPPPSLTLESVSLGLTTRAMRLALRSSSVQVLV